ncbi:transposase domain-containing protein [Bacillus gaemokensis]|uniref:transposase domain-containing protein n=1 Tax=Bacillus gaemokensis TaxID=574375 RepID=UPI0012902F04
MSVYILIGTYPRSSSFSFNENGLIPYEYLKYMLEQMPNGDLNDPSTIAKLLPWAPDLPSTCFVPKSKTQ